MLETLGWEHPNQFVYQIFKELLLSTCFCPKCSTQFLEGEGISDHPITAQVLAGQQGAYNMPENRQPAAWDVIGAPMLLLTQILLLVLLKEKNARFKAFTKLLYQFQYSPHNRPFHGAGGGLKQGGFDPRCVLLLMLRVGGGADFRGDLQPKTVA